MKAPEVGQRITLSWDTKERKHPKFKVPFNEFKFKRVKFLGFDSKGNYTFKDDDKVVRSAPPYAEVVCHRK